MADILNVSFNGEKFRGDSSKIHPSFCSSPELLQLEMERKTWRNHWLTDKLGLKDYTSLEVWRASVGELLGTATLVFMTDTIAISSQETPIKAPKLLMAILSSITLALVALALIPVSGGYVNPIVSLTASVLGVISFARATIYTFMQCLGGILGALALKGVVNSTIEQTYSLGGCTVHVVAPGPDGPIITGLEKGKAFWLEVICSFIYLFCSRWIAVDPRQAKVVGRIWVCSCIGIASGLNVFISTTVTQAKGYSGAGVNPARCFGTAVVRGGHLWDAHWIYWIGPAIAVMVFWLYIKIIPTEHFQPRDITTS